MTELSTPSVGGGMHRVLLGACRLAGKHKEPSIGADALLVSMLTGVQELGAVLGFPSARPGAYRATRQRPAMAAAGASALELEAAGAMRETHWRTFGVGVPAPEWTQESYDAVLRAVTTAATARLPWVGNNHLLEALLADPYNRAHDYVRHHSIKLDMLDEAARRLWPSTDREPRTRGLAKFLEYSGVLADPALPQPAKPKGRWVSRIVSAAAQASPVLAGLEEEAVIHTVRLGHPRVTPVHLMLALLTFEDQMLATGLRPVPRLAAANDVLLAECGALLSDAVVGAANSESEDATAPPHRKRVWRSKRGSPPWTVAAARVADRARQEGEPGSHHLLHAILEDEDGSGRDLLRRLGVDLDRLKA